MRTPSWHFFITTSQYQKWFLWFMKRLDQESVIIGHHCTNIKFNKSFIFMSRSILKNLCKGGSRTVLFILLCLASAKKQKRYIYRHINIYVCISRQVVFKEWVEDVPCKMCLRHRITHKDHINNGTGAHQCNLTHPNNAFKKSWENETNCN